MQENERQYAEEIRRAYQDKNADEPKLERLRKLDRTVRRPAEILAYTFGVLGALVLGIGMCLAMKVLGDLMPLGIAVGVVGIAMVTANYFLYRAFLKSRKQKYAKAILALSDEILN